MSAGTLSATTIVAADSGGELVAFTRTLFLGVGEFAAMHDRWMTLGHYIEGVAPALTPGSNTADARDALLVTGASGGLTVTVGAGWAFIEGDDQVNQGMYADYNDGDSDVTQDDGAPSGSNKRADIVVATLNDSEHAPGRTPVDQMALGFVTGTEGATPSLTDKSTWPALPVTSLPLAVVLMDSNGIVNAGGGNAAILDVRRLYGPSIFGTDGQRYRVVVNEDGVLGTEQILPFPSWVVTS